MNEFLESCPCNICLVQAACKESCIDEIIWYSRLTKKQRDEYIELGKYKSHMSNEAANYVSDNYNGYLQLLSRRKE